MSPLPPPDMSHRKAVDDADEEASYSPELVREIVEGICAERDALLPWRTLYRRAVNEANGLTNYVEDRPELRHAERRLAAIESEARAIDAARAALKGAPK